MSENKDYDETEQMPTVTTLLDRRKLRAENLAQAAPSSPKPAPRIKTSSRAAERRGQQRLELWTADLVARAPSPEVEAVRLLLAQGASWVLVLLRSDGLDEFEARAVAGGDRDRWAVWTGLRVNRTIVPALLQSIEKSELLSLKASDPSAAGALKTLGCSSGESAWVFRIGPPGQISALLVAGSSSGQLAPDVLQQVLRHLG